MKLQWTVRKMAEITGGTLQSATPTMHVSSIVTDSRIVGKGDCFLALKGERFDAREFIPQVLQKGASVIIAQKGYNVPADTTASFIWVDDSLKALQALAKYRRLNSTLKVAAITGSNGKSTTKQMLRAICSAAGETVANMGNLNNQFGVPFSLLEIQPKHKYGVFELGASHPGDIAETAALAVPDVAVITNVGPSHLEFFHDLETVYQTKTEIAQHLNAGGTLVYNVDDPLLARLDTQFKGKHISFGFSERADLRILETEKFAFTYKGEAYLFDVHFERHDKLNAAAACAAAIALGIYMDPIKQGLSAFTPMPMRLERVCKGKTDFILDCYNANPASMQNALAILGKATKSPRIAVLGDMKELGEASAEAHRTVVSLALNCGAQTAWFVGAEFAKALQDMAAPEGVEVCVFEDVEAVKQAIDAEQPTGRLILIKGSNSTKLHQLPERL